MSRIPAKLLAALCLLLLAGGTLAACGGGEPDPIQIELPTVPPLSEAEIRATVVMELRPTDAPTPTADAAATRTAALRATRGSWPLQATRSREDGYYLNYRDVDYLQIFGPVMWHATRVDMLVSGLYIGYVANNADLADFFGRYELVDRPEQWKCHSTLRAAVYREMVNLRRAHDALADYEVEGVTSAVVRYANELHRAINLADQSGQNFLTIQDEVCATGYAPVELQADPERMDRRRDQHTVITTNTALFHRFAARYGCIICGELYRR